MTTTLSGADFKTQLREGHPKLARSLGQAQKEFKTGLDEGAKDEGKDGEKGH